MKPYPLPEDITIDVSFQKDKHVWNAYIWDGNNNVFLGEAENLTKLGPIADMAIIEICKQWYPLGEGMELKPITCTTDEDYDKLQILHSVVKACGAACDKLRQELFPKEPL
jgi:hypothetical protein